MCYIDGQKNKYSVLNECNRMLKYNKKKTIDNVQKQILQHPVALCRSGWKQTEKYTKMSDQ
jgi:hypothetical protein